MSFYETDVMVAPLKVLMLSPEPNVPGGVVVFAELLKKYLECDVTSFWVGSSPERSENFFLRARRLIWTPVRLWMQLKHMPADIVHLNPSFDRNSLLRDGLLLLVLRAMRFPATVVYFHGWDKQTEAFVGRSFVCRHLLVWLLGGARRVLVLSADFEKGLITLGVKPDRITRVHTMYDAAPIKAAQLLPANTLRRSVLFMSRFVRAKGVYELLEGFARIASDFPDVDLIFAGDGEERCGLQILTATLNLRSRVLFTGYVSGEVKSRLLVSCTLFALPTYFPEGMPIALLEALGAGKPVLTAKAGGIPYILRAPDNGIVLEKVTPETVTEALRMLLSDPEYCVRVGTHNAVYAEAHFEAQKVARDMQNLYYQIVHS